MKRILLFLCTVLCFCCCDCSDHHAKERQVLLVYLAGNNSLSLEGMGDLEDIKKGWLPSTRETGKIVLIYHHFKDATPALVRLSKDSRGNVVEDVIMEYPFDTNSASASTLATVLADARKAWPAAHHGLILWSHGSGFLPSGYYVHPNERAPTDKVYLSPDPYAGMVKAASDDDVKSFAEDNGREMELKELCQALSGTHYDFILFDACLMANVEVAYELRNLCDYLLFSPTEILSDGFPYESLVQPIFTLQPEAAMRNIAVTYMNHYRACIGVYASATISLVRTANLEALATACKPIFQNHREKILTIDRSKIQAYFRYGKHWFYDIDDFVRQAEATDTELQAFTKALNAAVIYLDATDVFIDLPIKHYSGLSIYIPRPEYTVLNNYYKTLAWNQATNLVQ